MLKMIASFFYCATVFPSILSLPGVVGKDRAYQPGDITLGGLFLVHFTTEDGQCGDLYPTELGDAEAMIFAIERINRNPNLLPNITLGYDIRDYCESASKAMEHTYDFVRRNDIVMEFQNASHACRDVENKTKNEPPTIAAVIGPTDSGSAVLVGSLLQVGGIPTISHSATSNELSSPEYRHFFRTVPPDAQQASAMADLIEYFSWSYVAAVAMDDSYGRNGVWKLASEAERRQTFCLAFAQYIPRKKYNTTITRIVREIKTFPNIGVVVLWVFGSYGNQFLKEAAKQELLNRTLILSDGLAAEEDVFVGLKHEHQRILHGALGFQPPYLDMNSLDFDEFLIKETFRSLENGGVPWWSEFWQEDDKRDCILTKNPNERETCMKTILRRFYETYIPYVADAVTAVAYAIHNMKNCSAPECENPEGVVDPRELWKHLRSVNFQGLTGWISFDQLGDPVTSSYEIVHFQVSDKSDPVKLVIGSWDKSRKTKLHLNVTKIKWNTMTRQERFPKSFCHEDCPLGTFRSLTSPCCWECLKCPDGTVSAQLNNMNCTACPRGQKPNEGRSKCLDLPEIEVTWSSLAPVLVILFATIGFILVAICSFILYKHRQTPLVKGANRELSSILMITITMSFSVSILSLVKPTDFMCSVAYCWRSMVLVTFISILIIKTMKILSAFQINLIAERFKKYFLAAKRQTLIVLALIFPSIVFFSLWIALDSPHQQRIIQINEGTVLLSCSLHQSSVGMSLQIVISVYTSLLAVVCTYYAFKARTLPENFNEARYIGFSMYILLLSSVAYFPIDIGLKGSYATNLTCALTLVSSYGLLTCMFGPKIYVILFIPEKNTQEAVGSQVSDYSFSTFGKGKIAVAPRQSNNTSNQRNLQLEFASTNNSRI